MVVLIPKGVLYYRVIGLVEMVWKVVLVILNLRFTASVTFHYFLHGFQSVCGTGNAYLKTKMLHQLEVMREDILYAIFLDLHKSYDALESDRCMYIM